MERIPNGRGGPGAKQIDMSAEQGAGAHFQPRAQQIRVGILTISDRSSAGETTDESGPAIRNVFTTPEFVISVYACIADERKQITKTLRRWADDDLCDCIVTTGGTGLSARDITPEATARVLDSISRRSRFRSPLKAQKPSLPRVSRGLAGARGKTLIVNLPGSPAGARDGAIIVAKIAGHAVKILSESVISADRETPMADGAHADV